MRRRTRPGRRRVRRARFEISNTRRSNVKARCSRKTCEKIRVVYGGSGDASSRAKRRRPAAGVFESAGPSGKSNKSRFRRLLKMHSFFFPGINDRKKK